MSTRIEVKYICDRCQNDDLGKDDIQTFHVSSKSLGRSEYEFDLCEKCSTEFKSEYLPFVKIKQGQTKFDPHPCTFPECTFIGKNAGSLGVHKGKAHPGFHAQERLEQAASKGVPCVEEGCDFVALSDTGLANHLRQSPKHKVSV